jgi:hypothetical protein
MAFFLDQVSQLSLYHIRFCFFVGEASQKISGRVKDMDDKVGGSAGT